MITAKEAREIFEASDALIDISNKIRSSAEKWEKLHNDNKSHKLYS